MPRIRFIYLVVLLSAGFIAAAPREFLFQDGDLAEKQKIGENIFSKGIGSGESITARMSGVDVPARVMPCINCHKASGTGNPEGGIIPSNITWNELTKSYGGQRKNGNKYPPYTEQTLKKAITMGMDPGGNELNNTMPRYNMSLSDLNSLVSYLKTLGNKEEVGINNTCIRIGVALSDTKGANPECNEILKKTLNAYCDHVNKNGGIYGRKLETEFFLTQAPADDTRERLQKFLKEKNYFGLTGFRLQDQTELIAQCARISETPALMTFSQNETPNGYKNPYAFYLYPSLAAQGKSLVDFSATLGLSSRRSNARIIYQDSVSQKILAEQIALHYFKVSGFNPTCSGMEGREHAIASDKNITDTTLLFCLASGIALNKLVREFHEAGKHPCILVLGTLSDINFFQLPEAFKNKMYVAYPVWMTERSLAGVSLYQSLKKEYGLDSRYKSAQLDALAVIMTLEECFKRVGKDLTKEKVMKTMEQLYEYRTGLTCPLTYNANQRVGSNNVYITAFSEAKKNIMLVSTLYSKEL